MSRGLAGIDWHLERVSADEAQALSLAFVRDEHLRVTNGTVEDNWIAQAIAAATRMAERITRRPLTAPQTWQLLMDRFACDGFEVPWPPFIEVLSFTYIDQDGAEQELDANAYQVSAPTGPMAGRARIAPAYNTTWPIARRVLDAVTLEFRAGYVKPGSPETLDVPDDITNGMLLVIGELYEQRSLSLHGVLLNAPAVLRATDIFMSYRVY